MANKYIGEKYIYINIFWNDYYFDLFLYICKYISLINLFCCMGKITY